MSFEIREENEHPTDARQRAKSSRIDLSGKKPSSLIAGASLAGVSGRVAVARGGATHSDSQILFVAAPELVTP